MWTDNETDVDFLNFSGVAKTAAEMIRQVQPKPVSIGVSGVGRWVVFPYQTHPQ